MLSLPGFIFVSALFILVLERETPGREEIGEGAKASMPSHSVSSVPPLSLPSRFPKSVRHTMHECLGKSGVDLLD